jgi:hypothetical protein
MGKDLITQDKLLLELQKKGMTDDLIAEKLVELLDWEEAYVDKNGNCHMRRDGNLRLKAIELWLKIKAPKQGTKNNHLHIEGATLDRLLGKGTSGKKQSTE